MYQKYQAKVHNEKKEEEGGFKRFLCQNPLFDSQDKQRSNAPSPGNNSELDKCRGENVDHGVWPEFKGGYHMIYFIDGEPFAAGISDFLPSGLSSVYFLYDPKYEFL